MKGSILATLASLTGAPVLCAAVWSALEASQLLNTSGKPDQGGVATELDEVESRMEEYPLTIGFLQLLVGLTRLPVPLGLGVGSRAPGVHPYLEFVLHHVLLKYNHRAYKSPQDKWEMVSLSLEILHQLLTDYELSTSDLLTPDPTDQLGGVAGSQGVAGGRPPGFTVLTQLLTDSQLFKTIQAILEEAVSMFSQFSPFPGAAGLERSALLGLQLMELAGDRQGGLQALLRETSSPLMISGLERLLMAVNPRTRRADYLVTVAQFVCFNASLPRHTLAAVKILCHVCRETPSHSDIINIFTADQPGAQQLLHGFVECLDSNAPEVPEERASALLTEAEPSEADSKASVQNQRCSHLLQLLLLSLELGAPSLSHWLLGFQLNKVSATTLQEPGVLDSPKTCLHSVLSVLEQGLGSRDGPTCLLDRPALAEQCFHLVYTLCGNPDTSAATLRYLRTTHDFLFRQLQHLPLDSSRASHDLSMHQAWLLKTAAIELRTISLNQQRSHMQRLLKVLLGDEDVDLGETGDDLDLTTLDPRDPSMSATGHQSAFNAGKQLRHRILGCLDSISFELTLPQPMHFNFFDKAQVETLVRSLERRSKSGVAYVDVRGLRRVLMTELASQQGPMVAGHRPLIMEEIQGILETVVEHNHSREQMQHKKFALDAWRQLVEVLLTSVPRELLPGERRQGFLFDLTQELLVKVTGEDVHLEVTTLTSDCLLTLMAELRACFTSSQSGNPSSSVWQGRQAGSRAACGTALQVVLRGLIKYILQASGGQQKVKVNLYGAMLYCLQICAPSSHTKTQGGIGMERLLSGSESEMTRLAQENMDTINAHGDALMDALCRDACDGHHVGRMLALSVLDCVLSMDSQGSWLNFLSGRGYLQHLIDSLVTEDDQQLLELMTPQPPSLRPLYIFTSKMSLLTRIASTPEGANLLLHGGALDKLAACSVISLRPQGESDNCDEEETDLLPSPLSRHRQLFACVLRLCLQLITSLGSDNKEAATQVMVLLVSHGDLLTSILRSRPPTPHLGSLRELALTTAVLCRANLTQGGTGQLMEHQAAQMELHTHRLRVQDQMLALLPHYSRPETLGRQTASGVSGGAGGDHSGDASQITIVAQEIAGNLSCYCRAIIANIGCQDLNQRLLFGPSLDDWMTSSVSVGQRQGLGLVVTMLAQAANHFTQALETHHHTQAKLANVATLSLADVQRVCGASAPVERLSSSHRQALVRQRLQQLSASQSLQLGQLVTIVENCLYILWRHLEFFLVHCVPADARVMTAPALARHSAGMRRLTGAPDSLLIGVQAPPATPGLSQSALGVSKAELELLCTTAPAVLTDAFFKKVHTVDQGLGKERSHYSFSEAMVRRIKRVLKLHTAGNCI